MTFRLPQRPTQLLRNLELCVDEAFAELIHGPWRSGPSASGWQSAMEVRETADEYLVLVDLPDMPPENVNVYVEDQTLVVHGKRSSERRGQAGAVVYTERVQGEIVRRIPLPGAVDEARLQFGLSQGLLFIRLPKRRTALGPTMEPGRET